MGRKRTLCAAALAVAVLAVLVVLVIWLATPHRCFLDVLNAEITRQSTFEPFYAASDGRWGLPTPGEVVPGLERVDAAYPEIRDEMERAVFGEGGGDGRRLPPMHEMYNNIFMYKGSGAAALGALQRAAAPLQRIAGRLVYGEDTDIFDRIGSDNWRTFNLILFGRPVPGNAELCPRTVELLRGVPGVQSALFSVLLPGAHIPPHSDPAKGVVRYHLALRVPPPVARTDDGGHVRNSRECYIEVDCDHGPGCPHDDALHRYRWEEGKSVLFDDAFSHWVQNDTDELRVILFVDVLRPLTGTAKALQGVSNFANRYHPGVLRLIRESAVAPAAQK